MFRCPKHVEYVGIFAVFKQTMEWKVASAYVSLMIVNLFQSSTTLCWDLGILDNNRPSGLTIPMLTLTLAFGFLIAMGIGTAIYFCLLRAHRKSLKKSSSKQ